MKYIYPLPLVWFLLLTLTLATLFLSDFELPLSSLSLQPDSGVYFELAKNLASDQGFSLKGEPTATREVGYPFVLSLFLRSGLVNDDLSFKNLRPVFAFQILLFFISLGILAAITKSFAGNLTAILCLCFGTAYIPIAQFQIQLLSESLYIFAMTLFIGTAVLWRKKDAIIYLLLMACLLGLACLIKSVTIAFIPLVGAYILYHYGLHFRAFIFVPLFLILALSFPLSWTYRNQESLGSFVLSSTKGGSSLYRGNLILYEVVPRISDTRIPEPVRKKVLSMKAWEADAYLFSLAINKIRDNPLFYLKQFAFKVSYALLGTPSSPRYTALFIFRIFFLIVILSRLYQHLFSEHFPFLITAAYSLFCLVIYSMIYSCPRYFAPCTFLLIPYFSEGLTFWGKKLIGRNSQP